MDLDDVIQVWCNIKNDNIIGAFPNAIQSSQMHNTHFTINNTFQTGNFVLQFQQTDLGNPASYNPQALISSQAAQRSFNTVVITIEFVKHQK